MDDGVARSGVRPQQAPGCGLFNPNASGVGASWWRAADPIPAHADGVAVKHSRNDAFDWLHDSIRQFGMLR